MTGWRIGYGLGPQPLMSAAARVQGHDTSHPTSFVQSAALTALEDDGGGVARMMEEYGRRRERIVEALGEIPGLECGVPGGAFYAFPAARGLCQSSGCPTTLALAERLILEARIAVVPGEAFGRAGYLRFSYALSLPRIEEGISRLRQFAGSR